MNIDLEFLLYYNKRQILIRPEEMPKYKRILQKIGIKQKPNRANNLIGKYNVGRFQQKNEKGKCEIYLDEINKNWSTDLEKEKQVIETLIHEYLHFAMVECVGTHQELWVECMTEETLR